MYIGFTGLDGAGKSTQSAMLAQFLRSLDRQCYVTESKDDLVAQLSQSLAKKNAMSHRDYYGAYAFELSKAFSAVRFHFSVAQPLLLQNIDVIDPRTHNCRIQLARSHDCENIEKIEEIYNINPDYDLLFFINVDPLKAYERIMKRGTDSEDLKDLISFNKELLIHSPKSAIVIDGERPTVDIFNDIKLHTLNHLDFN